MKKVFGLLAILFTASVLTAQAPKSSDQPKTKEIAVQSSVSENALTTLYKDLSDNRDKASTTLQQARASLDAKNKPIQAQIAPLQKQIEANNEEASKNFQTAVAPFNNNIVRDQAQIDAIAKLVKQEQNLPDNANFDLQTGKWVVPDMPSVVPAPAKK